MSVGYVLLVIIGLVACLSVVFIPATVVFWVMGIFDAAHRATPSSNLHDPYANDPHNKGTPFLFVISVVAALGLLFFTVGSIIRLVTDLTPWSTESFDPATALVVMGVSWVAGAGEPRAAAVGVVYAVLRGLGVGVIGGLLW